jgi:hypothetical protein
MRSFNEADRKKKSKRIQIQENPGNLSEEALSQLEGVVRASLEDGYLPCPKAWKIAKESNVPKFVIGDIADRLGIRITNCQIGCFKIDKTPYNDSTHKKIDKEITTLLKKLGDTNQLTCAKVFDLGREFKVKPMDIANEVNVRNLKINSCQLGCF